jgi:heme/copper-type cytochrome/quinol oxidase subunit 2
MSSSPAMVEMLTYLLGTAGALIVLVTGIFVFVLVRRAREQRDREALDEARFESETLAALQPTKHQPRVRHPPQTT